jgi:chorismate synthase
MAHAMLSIPATKGFEFGSGFEGTKMVGSEHNDLFDAQLRLKTNHSGGSLGGISTGETFEFKVAFKPVSTISRPQLTSDLQGRPVTL